MSAKAPEYEINIKDLILDEAKKSKSDFDPKKDISNDLIKTAQREIDQGDPEIKWIPLLLNAGLISVLPEDRRPKFDLTSGDIEKINEDLVSRQRSRGGFGYWAARFKLLFPSYVEKIGLNESIFLDLLRDLEGYQNAALRDKNDSVTYCENLLYTYLLFPQESKEVKLLDRQSEQNLKDVLSDHFHFHQTTNPNTINWSAVSYILVALKLFAEQPTLLDPDDWKAMKVELNLGTDSRLNSALAFNMMILSSKDIQFTLEGIKFIPEEVNIVEQTGEAPVQRRF